MNKTIKVKARKLHRCDKCNKRICEGDVYEKYFEVSNGSISSFKTCSSCTSISDWLADDYADWPDDMDYVGYNFLITGEQ
jgi:hypothetical protein